MLGGGNDRLYGVLCDRLGHPEWRFDSRFLTNNLRVKNRELLDGMIEEETMKKTTQEWLDILEGSGMPYSAINDIQGTLNHSHGMPPPRFHFWFGKEILLTRTPPQFWREGWCRKFLTLSADRSNSSTHR
jgi:crotonobetainyl-CoA:carnitine CoA-transferase CaiB-like acyl-CoA transferase